MDYDGPAELHWQANRSLSITGPIHVQATALEVGWRVQLLAPTFEEWWFLFAFDSPFRLVFPDSSAFDIGIGRPDPDGRFDAWDWSTDDEHSDPCPYCGGLAWHVSVSENGDDSVTIVDRCLTCLRERQQVYRWPNAAASSSDQNAR
jgi:hypothetical protein